MTKYQIYRAAVKAGNNKNIIKLPHHSGFATKCYPELIEGESTRRVARTMVIGGGLLRTIDALVL